MKQRTGRSSSSGTAPPAPRPLWSKHAPRAATLNQDRSSLHWPDEVRANKRESLNTALWDPLWPRVSAYLQNEAQALCDRPSEPNDARTAWATVRRHCHRASSHPGAVETILSELDHTCTTRRGWSRLSCSSLVALTSAGS